MTAIDFIIIYLLVQLFVSHSESQHNNAIVQKIKETEKKQNEFLNILKQPKQIERFALTKYNK